MNSLPQTPQECVEIPPTCEVCQSPPTEGALSRGRLDTRLLCRHCRTLEKYRRYREAHAESRREKDREIKRLSRATRPEYHKEIRRRHYEKKGRDRFREYRHENRDKFLVYGRKYYARNAQAINAKSRKYHADHGERLSAMAKARYRQNPTLYFDHAERYRARKYNAPEVEKIDRAAIIMRDKSKCYLCGRALTAGIVLDHVIPLSRGGAHTADNLRVACRRCNQRKYNHLLSELPWYQSRDL